MPHIRFAARDPGAANVLVSFIQSWDAPSDTTWDVWVFPAAAPVFEQASIVYHRWPEGVEEKVLRRAWDRTPADVLVTGTSHYAPFEGVLWTIAQELGCPSLAVIDTITNTAERFRHGVKPDAVAAVAPQQVEELQGIGFRDGQIILIGFPWLVRQMAQIDLDAIALPPAAADDDRLHVLFVSEPIASDVAAGANRPYGFDEFEAFTVVHRAAVEAVQRGTAVSLAVKFHPYEDPAEFMARAASLPPHSDLSIHYLDATHPPLPWVKWATLVTGISSTLMIEAMILGKPVVSVQPGLRRDNTFLGTYLGIAPTLTDGEAAVMELCDLMTSPDRQKSLRNSHQALFSLVDQDYVSRLGCWISQHLNDRAGFER
jgi:hypothetical protein